MRVGWYKRLFDIVLALFGLILFSPLFILFSFLIWCEDRGYVFYKQLRMGKDRRAFQMLKFRSMGMDSEEVPTSSLEDEDARIAITRIGRFLRATAMDELPQIINILKGDMSFVGPRPIMPEEAQVLDSRMFSIRSTVRPGLTGLAQICADKYISNEEKLKYDLRYIERQSFLFDIKIIITSIMITLRRKWEAEGKKL